MTSSTTIGQWAINMSPERKAFRSGSKLEQLANQCAGYFPKENSLVQKEFGVPSLIVRFDCTVSDRGIYVYEFEDRPRGVGIACCYVPGFHERLSELSSMWPTFGYLDSGARKAGDDCLWLEAYNATKHQGVLVRGEPHEFPELEPMSISTTRFEGNKEYGIDMGWWRKGSSEADIDWGQDFVIKPLVGCMSRGILVWTPTLGRAPGTSTKTKITNAIRNMFDGFYIQPFHPPMDFGGGYRGIFRLFLGFSPLAQGYKYLGGLWMSRPNGQLIIHGTSESMTGIVEF